MRHLVAIEGTSMRDGRLILPGALYVQEERLPVTFGFNYSQIKGYATDFKRNDETGEITFEIYTTEDLPKDQVHASVECQPVEWEKPGDYLGTVVTGRIRSVTFLSGPWEW